MPPFSISLTTVLLLGLFQWVFTAEWRSNEQYAYGVLVPALTGVLLYRAWLRFADGCIGGGFGRWGLVLVALQIPLLLNLAIYPANPDWRMVLWIHAALTVASGLALVGTCFRLWGVIRFAPAWILVLFAVPWPTGIETANTKALMGFVAVVVEQILLFAGIFAERTGNLIVLANGPVGVDEACSGIRSMQLALMVAWFFGEWFRFLPIRRGTLIIVSVGIAIGINILRTLGLCLIFHEGGQELMNNWHDVVGNVAMFSTLGAVFGAAALLNLGRDVPDELPASPKILNQPGLSRNLQKAFTGMWLVGFVSIGFHYSRGETDPFEQVFERIDTSDRPKGWDAIRMDPLVRAQLRYTDVVAGSWESPTGYEPVLFAFQWDRAAISSFAGVHSPATCLPSSGWELASGYPIDYIPKNDTLHEYPLQIWKFRSTTGPETLTVLFGTRDERSGSRQTARISRTPRDRITAAIAGERILARESFGLYIPGTPTPETIEALLDEIVARR